MNMRKFLVFPFILALHIPSETLGQSNWQIPLENAQDSSSRSGTTGWSIPNKPPFVRSASGRKIITKSERPEIPLFAPGTIVTTGFPGNIDVDPYIYKDGRTTLGMPEDYLFIDPNGESATLLFTDDIGFSMGGMELTQPAYDKILARDVGLIFGIAIDQEKNRNLYLTATSAYGLYIVGQDENNDRVADRLFTGQPLAKWMPAQWGNNSNAGPGSIWKVDGKTGQISLFANIKYQGVENSGAGLGNIAFDATHNQLFVSDLDTGMIHRLNLAGEDIGQFDHGTMGRMLPSRNPLPFDPENRLDIENPDFDTEDPDTWAYTQSKRRVWGLTVHSGRLFYSVAEGPEIWSVGIDSKDGSFVNDARWELTISSKYPDFEISDMVFDSNGAMLLAQRGSQRGDYRFEKLTKSGRAEVLRYTYENPDDPDTPSVWVQEPHVYAVGFNKSENNTTGGIDVGPDYDEKGRWDYSACKASLWTTGENLRENKALKPSLEVGGELAVDGVQVQPVMINDPVNSPPWLSYFADYNAEYPVKNHSGHIGDVEVLGCVGGGANGKGQNPTDVTEDDARPEYPVPIPCLETFVKSVCKRSTGTFETVTIFTPLFSSIDRLELTDFSGALSSMPTDVAADDILKINLGLLAKGQPAQIGICGYNSTQKASGKPYDCCKATLTLSSPDVACEKETNQ